MNDTVKKDKKSLVTSTLAVTKNSERTQDLAVMGPASKEALEAFYMGPDHNLLFIPLVDFLISQGIQVQSEDHPDVPKTVVWTSVFRRLAKDALEGGEDGEKVYTRKGYWGSLLWDIDFLFANLERAKKIVIGDLTGHIFKF